MCCLLLATCLVSTAFDAIASTSFILDTTRSTESSNCSSEYRYYFPVCHCCIDQTCNCCHCVLIHSWLCVVCISCFSCCECCVLQMYAIVKSILNWSHDFKFLGILLHTLHLSVNMSVFATNMYIVLTAFSFVKGIPPCAIYSAASSIYSNMGSIGRFIS